MTTSNDQFWVIFDTSTRIAYYKDVHNLLAWPKNGVMRYTYREAHFSEAALKATQNFANRPSNILLLYGQWRNYKKGDPAPPATTPFNEIDWVPTRIGQMRLIPAPTGDKYYLDFEVLEYPKIDDGLVLKILQPLQVQSEVPFNKWVALSSDMAAFEQLRGGDDNSNWLGIINRLGTSPSQFAGDTFWRIGGLFNQRQKLISPRDEVIARGGLLRSKKREITSKYKLDEGNSYSLEIISDSPSQVSTDRRRHQLELKLSPAGPIDLVGNHVVDLRQYATQVIELRANREGSLDVRRTKLQLKTKGDEDDNPIGPEFELRFQVSIPIIKLIVAFVLAIIGLTLTVAGSVLKLWELAAIGGLCILGAALLITARFPTKLLLSFAIILWIFSLLRA